MTHSSIALPEGLTFAEVEERFQQEGAKLSLKNECVLYALVNHEQSKEAKLADSFLLISPHQQLVAQTTH